MEQQSVQPCWLCGGESVTSCVRCQVALCRTHAHEPQRRCMQCEREFTGGLNVVLLAVLLVFAVPIGTFMLPPAIGMLTGLELGTARLIGPPVALLLVGAYVWFRIVSPARKARRAFLAERTPRLAEARVHR